MRIGAFGDALLPVLWEDTVAEAMMIGIPIVAGLTLGVLLVLLLGWGTSVLARIGERYGAPGRGLAALALVAACVRGLPA